MQVGSTALITAGTIFMGMFFTGMLVGDMMGWSAMERVFLGGMLSMSSTTIIIKAFDDLGLKKEPFTNVVFGALVVEDLLAILLMVLLSTFAVSQKFEGMEMLANMGKLGFFLVFWFLVGIFLIPIFLKKAKKMLNEETLLILSVGLCFGMVVLARFAGFSSALGAFVMGSILGETIDGERIGKYLKGVKDLFGAIFFVSVGMMVDPAIIVEHWQPVLILTLVVAVAVITTFTTPYFIKLSAPFSEWIARNIPKKLDSVLSSYQKNNTYTDDTDQSGWRELIKYYSLRIVLYSVMLIAIIFASTSYLYPFLLEELSSFDTKLVA